MENIDLPAPPLGILHDDMPFELYQRAVGINASGLKMIQRSPAHYYHDRYGTETRKETPALRMGTLVHTALLEPERMADCMVMQPEFDKRTKAGKEAFRNFTARQSADAIVVTARDHEVISGIMRSAKTHTRLSWLLKSGQRETSLWWNDNETGELCKARYDFVSATGWGVDIKTCEDASPRCFQRNMVNYGYALAASHYRDGLQTTGNGRGDDFVFVAIEKTPPFGIMLYQSGDSVNMVGDYWRRYTMQTYSQCREKNEWPCYAPEFSTIELPVWAQNESAE